MFILSVKGIKTNSKLSKIRLKQDFANHLYYCRL